MEEDEDEDDFGFSPAPAATLTTAPSTGFSGSVVNRTVGNKQEVVLFRPGSFNDTSKAADDLRNRKAVIVNMENVDKAMARRVVDFLSGCVYALEGDVKKIAQSAYLFCPHNVGVIGDLESIQAEVEAYV
jgi:cell division inhibitor SepF